uniref:Uncharacterized protein n=1 Tax=Strigamia maritima TaxID=126957 RepID=T1JB11_STRMM
MDVLTYFDNRKIGCLDSGLWKRKSTNNDFGKLNVNFLLSKMRCNWEDDHLTIGIRQAADTALDEEFYEYPVPAFAAKFCPIAGQEQFLAVCTEEGTVNIMNTNLHGDSAYVSSLQAHENAVFDVCWVPGERNILAVSGDRTASIWDVEQEKLVSKFSGHVASVKWADFRPMDKTVFATAARDGYIIIWDTRSKKADNIIRKGHAIPKASPKINKRNKSPEVAVRDGYQSVTAVVFQDEHTLLSAGSSDGNIKVWDIRKNYTNHTQLPLAKHTIARKNSKTIGYSSLLFDSRRRYLFASGCDSVIYQYNCWNYSSVPVNTFTGHQNRTFFVKSAISPDDQYLLSGSSDNFAYIWAISHPGEPIFKLDGHVAEVTAVAWSMDPVPRIATCADDMRLKLWNSCPEGVPLSTENAQMGCVLKTPKSEVVTCVQTPCRPIKVRRLFQSAGHINLDTPANSTPTKRAKRRIHQENAHKTTPRKKICSPFKAVLSPSKIARNEDNIRRKLAFDQRSPIKCEIRSPTFNLPNSVMSPVSRSASSAVSPVVKSKECGINWLMQITQQQEQVKQSPKSSLNKKNIRRKLNRASPKNSKRLCDFSCVIRRIIHRPFFIISLLHHQKLRGCDVIASY